MIHFSIFNIFEVTIFWKCLCKSPNRNGYIALMHDINFDVLYHLRHVLLYFSKLIIEIIYRHKSLRNGKRYYYFWYFIKVKNSILYGSWYNCLNAALYFWVDKCFLHCKQDLFSNELLFNKVTYLWHSSKTILFCRNRMPNRCVSMFYN